MADNTKIEWAEATWNPITGCSVHSPGCTNCYAMKLAGTRLQNHSSRAGLTRDTKAGPVWTGEVRFNEQWLDLPLRWKRPRMIFVCAHADLFHENVPDEWIDRIFAVMALCPQHTFQVLTKRSDRMRDYLTRPGVEVRVGLEALGLVIAANQKNARSTLGAGIMMKATDINPGALKNWPLPNVWLGISAEDQTRWDERIGDLRQTPAAVRWVSAEPLLGEIRDDFGMDGIDWIVAGGESGEKARPMHPDWARSLRDQCAAADVPFFFKQWGAWLLATASSPKPQLDAILASGRPIAFDGAMGAKIGKAAAGRELDGRTHDEMPR